ncbi:MAG: SusC/RagA family TonB-linked outer membrane protein [Saprospiraceae bacterium]|nr:SusC/RagA family TonB-linked outer membrane protein [Saprospiraceae bacterium]
MKQLFISMLLLFFSVSMTFGQRTVSGKVTDSSGEAVIGANVTVKEAPGIGTITDIDGMYSLNVPAVGSNLVFSYTGYETKEVAIGSSSTLNVEMNEGKLLEEVVVTALGIRRDKKSLGYAVTDVSSDQLVQRSESDPIRALSGKVAGVNITGAGGAPGQSTKINIRGFSSLTGNTQPLFVVDGIPFDNSVNGEGQATQFSNRAFDIDPNNIESVSVLKGAAAAALYGSRATNGVILVTTKSGKKSNKGLEITYQSSYSQEKISSLPNYQDVYTQGSDQNYNGGFIGNWGAPFPNHVDRINNEFHAGTPRYSKIYANGYPEGTVPHPITGLPYTQGQGFPNVFPQYLEDDPNRPGFKRPIALQLRPYNFLEEFFETGSLVENSLSIATGDEKRSLSTTLSRMDNNGIVQNSKTSRTSISFGGSAKLDNGLSISGNVNYVNNAQASPPIAPSYYTDYQGEEEASIYSRLFYLPRNVDLTGWPSENPVSGNSVFYRPLDNPLWLVKNNKFTSDVNRSFGALNLSYPLTNWLSINARGGFNTYTDNQISTVRTGGVSDPNGRVWTRDVKNTELDFNYFLTASKNLSDDIDLAVTAGLNQNERSYSRKFIDGDGVIDNSVRNLSAVTTVLGREDFRRLQRLYAGYADINIGYKKFLYLGITGRNDWSSTLVNPKSPSTSQNSYFYPSFNTSFILSDALDLGSTFINYAKIRASYSQVGNEADPYRTSTVYNINLPFVSPTGTRINRASLGNVLGKADLINELTKELEFGTDLRLFNNRVGIDFSWFKRNSFNQITSADLPTSSGFSAGIVNAGEIQNKGIELALNLDIVRSSNGFNWNTAVNFTRIRSLIVDAGEGSEIIVGGVLDIGNIHREGLPYGMLFGTKNARVDNNDLSSPLLIDPVSGLPFLLPTNEVVGDPNPDFIVGLINTFTYKGITVSALFDWKQGGDVFTSTGSSLLLRGMLAFQEDREAFRVVPGVLGNPQTNQPILDENGNTIQNTVGITPFESHFTNGFGAYGASETNIYDGTVYRLREVSIGYTFPKTLIGKLPFGSLRLSVSGRNLWFKAPNFLKDLNADPEVLGFTADSNIQGIELGSTPNTRRIGINLFATF